MYEIRIVRIRDNSSAVYMGRGSFFGNPFIIDIHNNRDKVCDKYEEYFNEQVRINPLFIIELKKLNNLGKQQGYLELGCFCAPVRCHLETIKNFLENNQDLLLDQF